MTSILHPGRLGISYEQVASAADAILSRAERPTLKAVREQLGTGSFGTIQKHLGQWQAARREVATAAMTMPTDIQRLIVQEIEKQVTAARRTLEEEMSIVRLDRDTLADENQRISDLSDALQKESDESRLQLAHHAGLSEQLREELKAARIMIEAEQKLRINAEQEVAILRAKMEVMHELKTLQQKVSELETAKGEHKK
ncbi:MAG: DNA-binding protein [Oligoflexus sp.]|nr:DNA-binding protein [Oligoflexus sp.]